MPLPGFQRVPAAITDLQAALDAAIAARDRLERAVKVRPGDDPRLLGLVRGAKDALRAVADRTTYVPHLERPDIIVPALVEYLMEGVE